MTRGRVSLIRLVAASAPVVAGAGAVAGSPSIAAAVLAAALVAIAALLHPEPKPLQRPATELARCRRHDLEGRVMVVSLAAPTASRRRRRIAEEAARSLRLADGIAVLDGRRQGPLLCGVFSDPGTRAEAIERRLRSVEPGLDIGWARFPADGVTLESLLSVARGRSVARAGVSPPAIRLRPNPVLGMQTSSASSWRKEG